VVKALVGQQGQIGFTHQRADADVADRQAGEEAQLLGIAQGREGVSGFAGLRDGHEQRVRLHHHFAITEFAGDFHLARDAGQFFEPVTRDHAGVIAGAAGDDLHVAYFGEQLGSLWTEGLNQHLIVAQATFEGALDHGRLLVDFLEHVMAELTLVGGFGTIGVLHGLALDSVAVHVPDLHAVATDFSDIAFFQVHEAVSDLTQSELVGSEEVLAQTQSDHQWTATARGDQTIRLLCIDHCQTVGTVQLLDGCLERCSQVRLFLELVGQQVRDDFSVGVRAERVTQGFELFAQGFVVLDDAVVHHRNVTGKMRVSVTLARRAMGRPTGVGDTETTGQRLFGQRGFQFADLARTAHAFQGLLVGINRHTGAVIAAVFEALQAFEKDGGDITFSYCADNATHGYFS
jgi:hypothetical protein